MLRRREEIEHLVGVRPVGEIAAAVELRPRPGAKLGVVADHLIQIRDGQGRGELPVQLGLVVVEKHGHGMLFSP